MRRPGIIFDPPDRINVYAVQTSLRGQIITSGVDGEIHPDDLEVVARRTARRNLEAEVLAIRRVYQLVDIETVFVQQEGDHGRE